MADRFGQYLSFIGLNTLGGVIFAYPGGIARHVWTIKGNVETIDRSLKEAAAVYSTIPITLVFLLAQRWLRGGRLNDHHCSCPCLHNTG